MDTQRGHDPSKIAMRPLHVYVRTSTEVPLVIKNLGRGGQSYAGI